MKIVRAAFWLIRDVSVPSLRQHRLRTVLTLIGVVIGTQVVVAIAVLNRSILASFDRTVETIAGRADLQIANAMAGVPEDLATRIAAEPGVASAAGLVQGSLTSDHGDLALFGVDLLANQRVREAQFPRDHVHIADELRFINATDSVAVSTTFARRANLEVGSVFTVRGPTGPTALTVRGLLDPVGPAALFGGDVGLVDLPTAQRLLDREGRFDQIDVEVADDADQRVVAAHLRSLIGGAGTVEPPRERGARLGSMLSGVQTVLTLVSLLAIVVGGFIIFHTIDTAIAHRRRELTLARAFGYSRRALLLAITFEAVAYGLVGTTIGAVLGVVAARLSLRAVALGVGAIWGRTDAADLVITPTDALVVAAVGVGGAVVAALVPGIRAARMQIVEQLRDEHPAASKASNDTRTALLGAVVTAAGIAVLASEVRLAGNTLTVCVIMAGVILCATGFTYAAPLVLRAVAALARLVVVRMRPVSPELAVENILRQPARSRGALAALMVAFALVLIVNAFVRSLRTSILSWVDQTLAADLFVSPSMQLPLPSGPTISGSLEAVLRGIPGVAEVGSDRMINVRVGDGMAVLRTTHAGALTRQHYTVVEGDISGALDAFTHGEAVFVSDNFAYRRGLHAGDTLDLETPVGRRAFTIGAVVTDYTLDIGTIIVNRATYEAIWHDDLANTFSIWLEPGADVRRVREEIGARARPQFDVIVLTGREFNGQIAEALDNALLMTYAIQLVAIVIAVIGVLNFFLAEVVDRRREIGLLRGVALTPKQLRRMFGVEAFVLGVVGGTLAVAFGWVIARLLVLHSTRLVSGWTLTFEFPWPLTLATVAVAAVTAVVAGSYPIRSASAERVAALVAAG